MSATANWGIVLTRRGDKMIQSFLSNLYVAVSLEGGGGGCNNDPSNLISFASSQSKLQEMIWSFLFFILRIFLNLNLYIVRLVLWTTPSIQFVNMVILLLMPFSW